MLKKLLILVFSFVFFSFSYNFILGAGLTGAIYTTDSSCSGVDLNIYSSKESVYLNGGSTHLGAAGLPDGEYYVKVTEPNGTVLGTSIDSSDDTPVVVSNGEFAGCYQLSVILIKVSDQLVGYDTSSNSAGEYKVWVSSSPDFNQSSSKTDNYKIAGSDNEEEDPESARLEVVKFYDANANGINDDNQNIVGWKIRIQDGIDYIRFTPVDIILAPDDYVVSESSPLESNWLNTTENPVNISLENGDEDIVEFGNLCLGAGGGHTLGFWSNKNGQKLLGNDDLVMLISLNLRNADGTHFNPVSNSVFKDWLLKGKATNMSYMLSVQMAAAQMNITNGFSDPDSLIYAPDSNSANSLGFAQLQDVINEANIELGNNSYVLSGSPHRQYQESLKDALDRANNNINFVQAVACPFTFAE